MLREVTSRGPLRTAQLNRLLERECHRPHQWATPEHLVERHEAHVCIAFSLPWGIVNCGGQHVDHGSIKFFYQSGDGDG